MLGCDQMAAYSQGTVNFMTALACIQLENGLRPDQVALGLPAGPGAAGGGIVAPSAGEQRADLPGHRTNCGSFVPPRAYPGIRGAMTWSINWDASQQLELLQDRQAAPRHPALDRSATFRRPRTCPAPHDPAGQAPNLTPSPPRIPTTSHPPTEEEP